MKVQARAAAMVGKGGQKGKTIIAAAIISIHNPKDFSIQPNPRIDKNSIRAAIMLYIRQ